MASNLNKIIIIGTCAGEPGIDTDQPNRKEAHFKLATIEISGGKELTVFHSICVKNDVADYTLDNVHNGSKVLVEGKLHGYTINDNNNIMRRDFEIVADRVVSLDGGNEPVYEEAPSLQRPNGSWSNQVAQGNNTNFNSFGTTNSFNANNSGFGATNSFNSFGGNANAQGNPNNAPSGFNQGFNQPQSFGGNQGFGNAQGGFNQGFNQNQGFANANQSAPNNQGTQNNGSPSNGFGGPSNNDVPF